MLKNLFEYMWHSVTSEGGDGDMTVVFLQQDYRAVADKFQEFLNQKPFGTWNRRDREKAIDFWLDQESFTLTSTNNCCCWSDAEAIKQGKEPCTQYMILETFDWDEVQRSQLHEL